MNVIKRYVAYVKTVWSKESEGFGDTVAKITKAFGITPCDGCERRRKKFNEALTYRKQTIDADEADIRNQEILGIRKSVLQSEADAKK